MRVRIMYLVDCTYPVIAGLGDNQAGSEGTIAFQNLRGIFRQYTDRFHSRHGLHQNQR